MIIHNNNSLEPLFEVLDALPQALAARDARPIKEHIAVTARNGKQGFLFPVKDEIARGIRA